MRASARSLIGVCGGSVGMSSVQYRLSSQKVFFAKLQWKMFQEKLDSAEFPGDFIQAECFLQAYLLFLDQALWAIGMEVAGPYDLPLDDCSRLYPSSVEMLRHIDDCLQQVEVKSPEISRIILAQNDPSNRLYWLLQLVQHARGDDLSAKFNLRRLKEASQGNQILLSEASSSPEQGRVSIEFLGSFAHEVDGLIAALRNSLQEY
ncbi:MAG: hypothetical protein COB04_12795 [Gammaproteobacteria bacterium]|nr:MAG: hypothetical protein COB04_12795 [Gammaproteobacteria bacterium]